MAPDAGDLQSLLNFLGVARTSVLVRLAEEMPLGSPRIVAWLLRQLRRRAAEPGLARDRFDQRPDSPLRKVIGTCSFTLGMAGQVPCHVMAQAGIARAPFPGLAFCSSARSTLGRDDVAAPL
jgi:hypothetical protein